MCPAVQQLCSTRGPGCYKMVSIWAVGAARLGGGQESRGMGLASRLTSPWTGDSATDARRARGASGRGYGWHRPGALRKTPRIGEVALGRQLDTGGQSVPVGLDIIGLDRLRERRVHRRRVVGSGGCLLSGEARGKAPTMAKATARVRSNRRTVIRRMDGSLVRSRLVTWAMPLE
jgi:hypothetical protein